MINKHLARLRRSLALALAPELARSECSEAPPLRDRPINELFEDIISACLADARHPAIDGSYFTEIGPLVDHASLEAISAEEILRQASAPNLRLLDFGCGGMHHRTFIEALGFEWHGIDYLGSVSETVRDQVSQLKDRAVFYDGRMIPHPDVSFDVVWSMLVFQHIQNIDLSFSEMARVLRPGGRIIGQVAYLEQMQDFGTFNYTPYGLKVAAGNAGLQLTRVYPKHDVFSFLLRRLIITFTSDDDTPLNRMMGETGFFHRAIIDTSARLGLDTRTTNLLRLLFCTHFVFEITKPEARGE